MRSAARYVPARAYAVALLAVGRKHPRGLRRRQPPSRAAAAAVSHSRRVEHRRMVRNFHVLCRAGRHGFCSVFGDGGGVNPRGGRSRRNCGATAEVER